MTIGLLCVANALEGSSVIQHHKMSLSVSCHINMKTHYDFVFHIFVLWLNVRNIPHMCLHMVFWRKQPLGMIDKRLMINLPLRKEPGQMFSFVDGLYDFDLSRSRNLHQ